MAFLAQNNIPVLPWPALSPDLSPIEHLWDNISRRLTRGPQLLNVQQLEAALQ